MRAAFLHAMDTMVLLSAGLAGVAAVIAATALRGTPRAAIAAGESQDGATTPVAPAAPHYDPREHAVMHPLITAELAKLRQQDLLRAAAASGPTHAAVARRRGRPGAPLAASAGFTGPAIVRPGSPAQMTAPAPPAFIPAAPAEGDAVTDLEEGRPGTRGRPQPVAAARPDRVRSIGAIVLLYQAAASAMTPLLVVYQRLWRFTPTTVSVIFAVSILALLATLLVAGSLSDHVGRRPVLLASPLLEAVAMAWFRSDGGVLDLVIARALQGVATGLALPTLAATLVDFTPPHAPARAEAVNGVALIAGLAMGSLTCGTFVQYGPDPTRLVWGLLIVLITLAFAAVLALPETAARRHGALSSLIPRIGIPPGLRRDVWSLVPAIIASWALGGLYLSLVPSVAISLFGINSHFLGGLVATVLCAVGAVTAFALRNSAPALALRLSLVLLAAGTGLTLLGIETQALIWALAGTAVAGIGYGAAGLATFGALGRIATHMGAVQRSQLFAVAYVVAYLSFSLPALAAGDAATHIGLSAAVAGYAVAVVAVALSALALQELRTSRHRRDIPGGCRRDAGTTRCS